MNSGISGHTGREPGTCGGSVPLPRRMASSSEVGEVPCSSSVGFKREVLTLLSPLGVIREPHISESLTWNHMNACCGPRFFVTGL